MNSEHSNQSTGPDRAPQPRQINDIGRRPNRSPEPVAALEMLSAEQDAQRDSASYDTSSLLANPAVLPYCYTMRGWLNRQRAEALERGEDAVTAISSLAAEAEAGLDHPYGHGLTALEDRVARAGVERSRAEVAVDQAKERLDQAGATAPPEVSPSIRRWFAARSWLLPIAIIPLEAVVVYSAMNVFVRSEERLEAWVLTIAALFALSLLPKVSGGQLHQRRFGHNVAAHTLAAAMAGAVWVSLIVAIARIRAIAAYTEANDRSGTWGAGFGAGDEPASGSDAVVEVFSADVLFWALLSIMVALSLLIFIRAWHSADPERVEYVSAVIAERRATEARAGAEQDRDALVTRLEFLAEEPERVRAAAREYADSVLPTLAQSKLDHYYDTLSRLAGDPSFTDALRLVDRRLPDNLPAPAAAVADTPAQPADTPTQPD